MVYKILIILLIILKISRTDADHGISKKTKDIPMHHRHGVLTPYEYVGNYNTSEIIFPGCKAQKIWIFARHGTRYPFQSTMSKVINILPSIQKKIKNISVKGIKDWEPLFQWDKHGKMMSRGKNELFELGKRFRLRFPSLINIDCDHNMYKYNSTFTHRTYLSAHLFGAGLLGSNLYEECWHQELTNKSTVLEFYNYCEKWKKEIWLNLEARREERQFSESQSVTKILKNMWKRVGYKFSLNEILLIQQTCAYESAFLENGKSSPWCTLFLPEEFEILEYLSDLYSYWVHGYGYPLTYQQACPMLVDMFQFFDSNGGEKTMAYFGHDTAMWKIVALLGIYKDEHPLQGDSYIKFRNRKWRSTFISPFAANIAFVYYKCDKSKKRRILFLHQERIVSLPGCPVNEPCPLATMKSLYPSTNDECRFEELCAV